MVSTNSVLKQEILKKASEKISDLSNYDLDL